jgi:regulation of enolase protein 1 (concanavalin A-like superfamily)
MLMLETGERTDFWRDTLYGFCHGTGHALLVPCVGDFTTYFTFEGDSAAFYDQAGIMLGKDEARLIKTGIEVSDGMTNLAVVVTQQGSDWSTFAFQVRRGARGCG